MSFQEAFPELKAQAPNLPGQQNLGPSLLLQLRREQLHDLARAFAIKVKRDGTKQQILPVLIDAEQRGVFRTPAQDEYWLRKAARSPDDRGVKIFGQPKPEGSLAPERVPVEEDETDYEDPRPMEKRPIGAIRHAAAVAGMKVKPYSTKKQMLAYLDGDPNWEDMA